MKQPELTPEQEKRQELWLQALEGRVPDFQFRKGEGCLSPATDARCCLGVGCDIYKASHPEAKWEGAIGNRDFVANDQVDGCDTYLPLVVAKWFGLPTPGNDDQQENATDVMVAVYHNSMVMAVGASLLNDNHHLPFSQIAACIRANRRNVALSILFSEEEHEIPEGFELPVRAVGQNAGPSSDSNDNDED